MSSGGDWLHSLDSGSIGNLLMRPDTPHESTVTLRGKSWEPGTSGGEKLPFRAGEMINDLCVTLQHICNLFISADSGDTELRTSGLWSLDAGEHITPVVVITLRIPRDPCIRKETRETATLDEVINWRVSECVGDALQVGHDKELLSWILQERLAIHVELSLMGCRSRRAVVNKSNVLSNGAEETRAHLSEGFIITSLLSVRVGRLEVVDHGQIVRLVPDREVARQELESPVQRHWSDHDGLEEAGVKVTRVFHEHLG